LSSQLYKVNINNSSYSVVINNDHIEVNGSSWKWDLVRIDNSQFHLIHDSNSYLIQVEKKDPQSKQISFKLNGIPFQAQVMDRYDILLDKLGMNPAHHQGHLEVRAPMPGKILEIKVEAGQQVKSGDQLIVLEAMKMENIIKATGDGVVENIFVETGINVEKNQILIQF
jgi:biotin carboxyl carrier protein